MEIPYEVTPRRDTGLYNAKLGVWLFLASEVMLFGGLFSAYVFLRVGVQDGVDNPWPWGVNVHKDFVWLGFVNTLVLIASSVGVVFAWVALKERKWRLFQVYMYSVVACAAIFMCIKAVEYNSKLNHHHGIKLTDNSVMEGHIVDDTDEIRFRGSEVNFGLQTGVPMFLDAIEADEFPTFTVKGSGKGRAEPIRIDSEAQFREWFHRKRQRVEAQLAEERKRYRSELDSGVEAPEPVSVDTSASVSSEKAFRIDGPPRQVLSHSDSSMRFRDGTEVSGELIGDDVRFAVHEVDMQLVLPQDQRGSMVWDVIGDEGAKRHFFAEQQKAYEEVKTHYEKRGESIPERMLRGYVLNIHDVHVGGDHGGESHGEEKHGSGDDHGEGGDSEKAKPGSDAEHDGESKPSPSPESGGGHDGEKENKAAGEGHGGDHTITVPRDEIKFMGSHGPRYGNYYAIYFTMTALHGLHVVGGALVLLFFVVFGKKLYRKNPEHLANRVEVGGLFWHFVDLIWIFLFPVMYLL